MGERSIDSASDDNDGLETHSSVSHTEACEALGTALQWLEFDRLHLLLVRKWRYTVARKRGDNLKQSMYI